MCSSFSRAARISLVDLRAELAAHVFAAGFGLNGESGRNGQAGIGHLGQARAFAAQLVLHLAVAVGFAAAKEINIPLS